MGVRGELVRCVRMGPSEVDQANKEVRLLRELDFHS